MKNDLHNDINQLVNDLNNPFTNLLTLKTNSRGGQWATNQSNGNLWPMSFEIIYSDGDIRLLDGVYSSNLFVKVSLAASHKPDGIELIPRQERIIRLKN